jgi:hypothetical protein
MNRDDIIRMARESCAADKIDPWQNGFWVLTHRDLERFAALVAAAEREACAKVCDEMDHNGVMIAADCAAAIRARGVPCIVCGEPPHDPKGAPLHTYSPRGEVK